VHIARHASPEGDRRALRPEARALALRIVERRRLHDPQSFGTENTCSSRVAWALLEGPAMPSTHTVIRVVPRDLAWVVIVDPDYERLIDRLCTKERAIEHALELAEQLTSKPGFRVTVRIEQRNGTFEERHAA
jgi:hypothetical protein